MTGAVRIEGLDQANTNIRRLIDSMPAVAKTSIRAGAAVLGEGMEQRAPQLSGDMEGTIGRSVRMVDDGPLAVRVGPSHGLAVIFEHGGEITPRVRERLAFEGAAGFVRPGQVTMPAKPFVRPAVDEGRRSAMQAVRRSAGKALRAHGRFAR